MRKVASATTEQVLLESTRAYIEKFTSEMVAEDLKNPEIRAWLLDQVRHDYKRAKHKLGVPRTKRR